MAQYCEIAGVVTNCTDNCKSCLAEEIKEKETANENQSLQGLDRQ